MPQPPASTPLNLQTLFNTLPEWPTFVALNKKHEGPLLSFLSSLVNNADKHSRFLNMIALLEHLGARKLMVSQSGPTMSKAVLQHLSEETRHAYFFKHHAQRIAEVEINDFTPQHTLCPASAAMYIGRLDAETTQLVGHTDAYPWVSFCIELRACWLYHLYQSVLDTAGEAGFSLASVIGDEDHHLQDMQTLCKTLPDYESHLTRLMAREAALYQRFASALFQTT